MGEWGLAQTDFIWWNVGMPQRMVQQRAAMLVVNVALFTVP